MRVLLNSTLPNLLSLARFNRWQSLRWQLMAWMGWTWLAVLLAFAGGVSFFTYQTEQRAWQGRQSEAARNAAESVASVLQSVEEDLFVMRLGLDEARADTRIMGELLSQNPALLEIVYVDPQGQVEAGISEGKPVLANSFTVPQSTWYQQARTGKPYLGDVQISVTEEPYLIMATPIGDGGVVAARVEMDVLWQAVADIRFGQTGRAYIVDRRGEIIAHTDPAIVLARTRIAGRAELEALLQVPGNQWNGLYANFQNVPVVGSTAPVGKTDWVVITELSQSEAFATSRAALLLLGSGMLLSGIVAMGLTAKHLGRLIFEPIERLRAGAERLGHGDLAYRIGLSQQDEIGQVAEAFDQMAVRLQDREEQLTAQTAAKGAEVAERQRAEAALQQAKDELEMRVIERTAELKEANERLSIELVERKRAEEELSRFKLAIEQSSDAIFLTDLDGAITYVNPAFEKIYGFCAAEAIGQSPHILKSGIISLEEHQQFWQKLLNKESVSGEIINKTKDGRLIHIAGNTNPILNNQGHIIGFLATHHDITEQKQAEAQIKASLEEKVVLLKEIHHRVKNNLQVISSLLYLQSNNIKDTATLEIFKESQNRVKSMALIHEKLYQSSDLARIDFAEYVGKLAGYLHRTYSAQAEGVNLKINIEDVSLDIDTAIPCGLIINELMSNALKYAFPIGAAPADGPNSQTGMEIRIELQVEQQEQPLSAHKLTLIVADSGIGFPPEVDFHNTASLGLQLVNSLVNQLKGTIELHRNGGTEFKVEFSA